jgi:dihydrofolate reductase
MAKLRYGMLTSLDGFTEDASGNFDWAAPDDELHAFVNDVERPVGTCLYGRRMYEVMQWWETAHLEPDLSAPARDWANLWRASDKVVYSCTLSATTTERTTIERSFDPVGIRNLKAATVRDISIGGPHLAAEALRAGLVDELHQWLFPVVIGAGTRFLPEDLRLDLELTEQRAFASGVVYVCYRVRHAAA